MCLAYGYGQGVKKNVEKSLAYHKMLDRVSAAELAQNVFWGNGLKENKKLGLLLCYQAGNKGDNECIKTYNLWAKRIKL